MSRDLFGHMRNWLFGIALLASVACSSPISTATLTPSPSHSPTPTTTATANPPISIPRPLPISTPLKIYNCPSNCWELFQELNREHWHDPDITVAATYKGKTISPGESPDSISLFYRLGQHRVNYNPFERKMTEFSTREEFQQFILRQTGAIRGMLPEIAIEPIFDDTVGLPIGYNKWVKYIWTDAGYSFEDKIIREEVIAWDYKR